jgi:hypothetical protein
MSALAQMARNLMSGVDADTLVEWLGNSDEGVQSVARVELANRGIVLVETYTITNGVVEKVVEVK